MESSRYLILDTNVWVYRTRLLSTALGAAVLYSLHQTGRILALPEVIEEEIRKHTLKRGSDAVKAISENYRLIEQLMGVRDDFRVPAASDFAARVDARLLELEQLIKRTPFTLDHAKAALKRVMDETPPNGYKNQQFKDSAIWEAILDLARAGDVDFVTEDSAFFNDRKPNRGLAENLKQECKAVPGRINVYHEVSSYLESVKEELPPLNYAEIAKNISEQLWEELSRRAIDQGYELGDLVNHKISAFLTEKSNFIAIEFRLSYITHGVKYPESQENVRANEIAKGDCTYELSSKRVSDIRLETIYLEDLSGDRIPAHGAVFLRAEGGVYGRKTITYTLRKPLEE